MFHLIRKNSYFCVMLVVAMLLFGGFVIQPVSAAPAVSFSKMPSIVAKVNGSIITKYDFEQYALLIHKMEGKNFNTLEAQRELLENIVDVTLIEEFCKDQKLDIDHESALRAFDHLAKQNGMDSAQFESTLNSTGIDKDALLERLRHQMIVSNFRSTFLLDKVEVSKAEIRSNRARIIKQLSEKDRYISKVNLYELVVYKELMDDDDFADLKRDLSGMITVDNFSDLATKYSHNPSADEGGKVGWLDFKDLSPVYQSMIQSAVDSARKIEIFNSENAILGIKLDDIEFSSKFNERTVTDERVEEILKFEKSEDEMEELLIKMRGRSFIEIFI